MPRVRVISPPAPLVAAAHGQFSGAVVTLLPAEGEAARLALNGFEPPESLHVTLAWLGDTDGDPAPQLKFDDAVAEVRAALERSTPGTAIEVDAFAVATFNPASDERDPATVLLVQGDALVDLRGLIVETVGDASSFPVWFPHLTLGYSTGDALDPDDIAARMGPVTFDRVRVAWGSEQTVDLALTASEGEPMTASTKIGRRVRVTNGSRTVTAATADCGPCSRGFADDMVLPDPDDVGTVDSVDPGDTWEGVLAVEDTPTGDGRMMQAGSLRWEGLPLPLRWVREDEGEHRGAIVVGRILEIWRDGSEIRARGDFDAGSDDGREAARQVAEMLTRGVSVDLDDVDMEIRLAGDVLDEMEQPIPDDPDEDMADEDRTRDADGRVTVMEFKSDDELSVFTDARIRAATIVATPAFVEAQLTMAKHDDETAAVDEDQADDTAPDAEDDDELVAGSAPTAPPAAWFADPKLSGPTPVTISTDGRIFGHVATWGTCHTAYAHECVTPPASRSAYAYFRTGAVRTDDGQTVATGRITLDTNHAGRRLGAADTSAHYEHTGRAGADVAAGEDAYGIWIAGAVRPGLSDDEIRTLAASPLSGDWRRIGGALELVHVLAVNSPGFPVPRALVAGGSVQTLQASGVLERPDTPPTFEASDTDRLLAQMIERERRDEQDRRAAAQDARNRVLVASAAKTVRARR